MCVIECAQLSVMGEKRFWKAVVSSYFHTEKAKGQFKVLNLEGCSIQEKLVRLSASQ